MISIKKNMNYMQRFLRVSWFVIPEHSRCRRQAMLLLSVIFLAMTLDELLAADRIWLEPAPRTVAEGDWFPRNIEVFSGSVVAFDAEQFRVVRDGQVAETVTAAARVLWIEPDQISDLERDLINRFKQGEYAESLSGLPDTLKNRPAVWRQQWLTMLSANSAWKIGRPTIALELVGQLDRRPLPPMVLGWLPIAWENGVQPAAVVKVAKQRAQDSSAAVRLVAASWLLSSADRNQGLQIINELVKDSGTSKAISQLAKVLSWRVTPPPQVASLRTTWEKQIDALPLAVQTGPTRLLMDKLRASGQSEEAKRLQLSLELSPVYGLKQDVPVRTNQ